MVLKYKEECFLLCAPFSRFQRGDTQTVATQGRAQVPSKSCCLSRESSGNLGEVEIFTVGRAQKQSFMGFEMWGEDEPGVCSEFRLKLSQNKATLAPPKALCADYLWRVLLNPQKSPQYQRFCSAAAPGYDKAPHAECLVDHRVRKSTQGTFSFTSSL